MSSASVDTLIAPRLLSFTELTGLEQLHVADGSIAAENSHGRTSYTVNEDYEHKKRWMEPRTPPPPPPPPQPVSIPDDEKDIAFEACEQDQEDEEASAMVTGLLGKYTTLFDV